MVAETTKTAELAQWLDRVHCGDVFDVLSRLPDACACLAIVDGPYNMRKADWDKFFSWDDFRAFYRPLWADLSRVLRDNCSLYVFGTFEGLAALKPDLDGLGDGWTFASFITLDKGPVWKQVSNQQARRWPACAEYLLYYARERVDIGALAWRQVTSRHNVGANGVPVDANPIREYLNAERERAGVAVRDVAEEFQRKTRSRTVTGMAGHWFQCSQWSLPTETNYHWLRALFNARGNGSGPYLCREWDDLRREYEHYRYTFNPQHGVTDVWEAPICAGAERVKLNGETAHVAQKPLAIMRRIVAASSDEGDTVLVPFSGVGSAEVACHEAGRHFIGIERDDTYCAIAEHRIAAARRAHQPSLALEDAAS